MVSSTMLHSHKRCHASCRSSMSEEQLSRKVDAGSFLRIRIGGERQEGEIEEGDVMDHEIMYVTIKARDMEMNCKLRH